MRGVRECFEQFTKQGSSSEEKNFNKIKYNVNEEIDGDSENNGQAGAQGHAERAEIKRTI